MTRKTIDQWIGIAFTLPSILVLLLLMFIPTVQIVLFSLSDIQYPNLGLKFNALNNFFSVIRKPELIQVINNTLIWIFGTVVIRFLVGFWAAITMNTNYRGVRIFQLIALLPWMIPSIVAANTWRWVFQSEHGLLNSLLMSAGLKALAHPWLADSNTAIWAVLAASIWHGYPFIMIMLLAGMKGIPQELYDSAKVDGANEVQTFRYITLPNLKMIIAIILIMQTIWAWNSFDLIFVMTGGGPGGATEILGLFIYRLGFKNFDFGGAAAIGVIMLLVSFLFLIVYRIVYRTASSEQKVRI